MDTSPPVRWPLIAHHVPVTASDADSPTAPNATGAHILRQSAHAASQLVTAPRTPSWAFLAQRDAQTYGFGTDTRLAGTICVW